MAFASATDDQLLALLREPADEHKLAALLLLLSRDQPNNKNNNNSVDPSLARRAFDAMGGAAFLVRLLSTSGAPPLAEAPHITFERVALRAAALFCTAAPIANECDLSALLDALLLWLDRATASIDSSSADSAAAAASAAAALSDERFDGDVDDAIACLAGLVAGAGPAFEHAARSGERFLNALTAFARALMKRALPLQARVAASARHVPRGDDNDSDGDDDEEDDGGARARSAAPRVVDFKTMMEQGKARVVGEEEDEEEQEAPQRHAPKPFEKSPHAIPPKPKPPRPYNAICAVLDVTMGATMRAASISALSQTAAEAVADCLGFVFAISQNVEKLHAAEQLLVLVPTLTAERVAKSITLPAAVRRGLHDLLSSRLDDELRECALKLCALMTDVCGSAFLYRRGDDDKLVDLAIGLCAVEVRLIVEYAPLRLPAAESLLGACYLLLERALSYLTDDDTAWPSMSAKALGHIEQALRDAVRVLLMALDSDDTAPHINRGAIGFATARFLGAWLAEDAESVLPALINAVPTLWRFASVYEDGGDRGAPAILFLLPALQRLTSDAEGTRAVLAGEGAAHVVQCTLQCAASLQRWYSEGGVASEVEAHDFSHITPPGLFVTCVGVVINVLVLHLPTVDDGAARQALLASLAPLQAPLHELVGVVFGTASDPMPEETLHVTAFALAVGLVLLRELRGDELTWLALACRFVVQALPQRDMLGDAWSLLISLLTSALEAFPTHAPTCLSTGIREALAREIVGGVEGDEERKLHARLLRLLSNSDSVASSA